MKHRPEERGLWPGACLWPGASSTHAVICGRCHTSMARLLAQAQRGRLAPAVMVLLFHYAYGKPKETLALEKKPVVLVIRIDPPPEGTPRDEDYAEPRRLTDALEHRAGGQDIPTVALSR